MARIAYVNPAAPESAALAERIKRERGAVLHLYAMLLHSAPVADGWRELLTAIRQKSAVPGAVRELVIMRIAELNGAHYEADQHKRIALREGLSDAKLEALPAWQTAALFDERERAVLAYCDAMTLTVHVAAPIFAAVRRHFDDRSLVELTATIAAYNMVSRFIEAIDIHSTDPLAAQ